MRPVRLLTVAERAVAVREAGQGRPLVLIHGAGGSSEHWSPQLDGVTDAARVVAADLPGHGRSPGPGLLSIEAYADWVVELLDAVGLDRVVLGGHSMGGAVAQAVALAHPDRLAGLVLVATGARLRVVGRLLELLRVAPLEGRNLLHGLSYSPTTPPERVAPADRVLAETPPLVTLGDFLACDRFDARERLLVVRAPTLVVVGTDDRLTPPNFARFLAATIPGARLVEIEQAGHFPQLEQPEAVNDAIRAFLRSVDGWLGTSAAPIR